MTSTVLDVTVLLLCVSASVVILGGVDADPTSSKRTAADAADRLVTETATVRYDSDREREDSRVVHATLVELLVAATSVTDTDAAGTRFRSKALEVVADALGPHTRVDVRRPVRPGDGAASKTDTHDDESTAAVDNDTTALNAGDDTITILSVGPSPPGNVDVGTAVVRHPTSLNRDGRDALQIVVRVWHR